MNEPALHITVLAMSMPGEIRDLTHEARLVKAAALYADRVTLVSPKAAMLAGIGSLVGAGPEERREALEAMLRAYPPAVELMVQRDAMRRKRKGSFRPEELIAMRRVDERLGRAETEMVEIARRLVSDPSANELAAAIQADVLTLHYLGLERGGAEQMIQEALSLLTEAVTPRADTFPMFDDSAGGLLKALLTEGQIPGAEMAPAKQAGLAGRYIDAVDTFPDAPMDAVLWARQQLAVPLKGFRSGISELASTLNATPLDAEFGQAADDLYRRVVVPKLEELRQLSEERGVSRLLRREIATVQPGTVAAAALGLGATAVGQLPDVVQLAATAAPLAAGVVGGMARRREDIDGRRRTNKFLWLYEVGDTLATGGSRAARGV